MCHFDFPFLITSDVGFFVSWHMNLHGLFNAKAILVEEKQWYYLTHIWISKGVHAFLKIISLKMNVIAWLEFELTFFLSAVHHFSYYVMGTLFIRFYSRPCLDR